MSTDISRNYFQRFHESFRLCLTTIIQIIQHIIIMKCVNVRGKPFEGFEIQNQRTSFLLLWSVFYFYILKPLLVLLSGAQLCSVLSRSISPIKILNIY